MNWNEFQGEHQCNKYILKQHMKQPQYPNGPPRRHSVRAQANPRHSSGKRHTIQKQSKKPPTLSQSPSPSRVSPFSTSSNQIVHYDFKIGEMMGHYQVSRLLGDGTFGRVVEGEHKGKMYAIKVIRPIDRYIESAEIEKDILKRINRRDPQDKEAIVRYKHSFLHQRHLCLVFKPLGKSLYEVIKMNEHRGFKISLVQSFFRQILKAVSFLHRIGYTHTDLKPQNILLEKKELIKSEQEGHPDYYTPASTRIRIIDFGGATKHDEYHSSVICTRQYRPPEVILGCCQWNELADVWSIGCIIAELVSGDLLFPAQNDTEHLLMIEKNCGRLPGWMIHKTASDLGHLFLDGQISQKQADKRLPNWGRVRASVGCEQAAGECMELRELLRECLQRDPSKRISCSKALQHGFFKLRL